MATWIRSFTADLTGTANTALAGPADLSNDTAPTDFDPAAVNSVRFQFTLSHTGTFAASGPDSFALQPVEIETTGGTQLADISPTGTITNGTATVAVDLTDSAPSNAASTADWSGAQFNGVTANAVTNFTQSKGADGVTPQILASSVTITIDYTPGTPTHNGSGAGTVAFTGTATGTKETPGGGGGVAVLRQSKITATGSDAAITTTFDSAPVEGNLLVVYDAKRSTTGSTTATIDGTGWTLRHVSSVGAAKGLAIWTKVAGASEPSAIETYWAGAFHRPIIMEFEGGTGWTFEQTASNVPNDNASLTSLATGTTASVSTTKNLVLGFLMIRDASGGTITSPTWATQTLDTIIHSNESNGRYMAVAVDYDDTATGTKASTASWTGTNTGPGAAIIVLSYTAESTQYGSGSGTVTFTGSATGTIDQQIERPISTITAGNWDTAPTAGQTLHGYTSDESDTTYIFDTVS